MIFLAWWLLLCGMWPMADPGHAGWSLLVVTDRMLHLIGLAMLVASFVAKRGGWQQMKDTTVGCIFGGHGSCDGWADASRAHGLGYQHPCGCACHREATP